MGGLEMEVSVTLYPIIGGPKDLPVCGLVSLKCILAKGDQRNCGTGENCKKIMDAKGYKFAGRTWVCKSCEVPFGSNIHSMSCGIGGPGAK
ncbi:hypothetical protein D4R51_04450 [bacterium]|nr:MAG: hypothetical protein D4R51_04450 [bacterium]